MFEKVSKFRKTEGKIGESAMSFEIDFCQPIIPKKKSWVEALGVLLKIGF